MLNTKDDLYFYLSPAGHKDQISKNTSFEKYLARAVWHVLQVSSRFYLETLRIGLRSFARSASYNL